MNFKKIVVVLIVVLALILAGNYAAKEYLFPLKYDEIVTKYSEEFSVDKYLILSVIKAESNFSNDANSHKKAKGLMQLVDSTAIESAEELGILYFMPDPQLYDAELNIQLGTYYIDKLLEQYNGDIELTLAAYNAGMGNVAKWLNDKTYSSDGKSLDYIPFGETKKYVDKVKTYYNVYKYLYNE